MRRRRRKFAAAAGALLLVPAVVAGEPAAVGIAADSVALNDVGRGLVGLTDSDEVSGDGTLIDNDRIGADLLKDAGNPEDLKQEGLDLPSGPLGIPGVMLQAYQRAADSMAKTAPNCHLHWSLLASIGRIETNHARGGQVFPNGDTVNPILGPVLNGGGFAAISDTDGGVFDQDSRWDRAVGAMQFIPLTWRQYASDGNGDRVSNPHNVFDAALAAGKYLCSGGLDLSNPQQRAIAVFRYNRSDSYVRTVLIWADAYAQNVVPLPSTPVVQAGRLPVDPTQGSMSGTLPADPTTPTATTTTTGTTTTTTTTTGTTTTTTTAPPTCESTTPPPTSTTEPSTSTTPPTCETTTTTTPPSDPPADPPGGGTTTSSSTE